MIVSLRKNLESRQIKGTPGKPTYLATNLQYTPLFHSWSFLPKNVILSLHLQKLIKSQNQFPPSILPKMKIKKGRKKKLILDQPPRAPKMVYNPPHHKATQILDRIMLMIPIGSLHSVKIYQKQLSCPMKFQHQDLNLAASQQQWTSPSTQYWGCKMPLHFGTFQAATLP